MERTVTATQANRDFSRILNEVAAGQTYVVTSRGKPLARMEPAGQAPEDDRRARLDALLKKMLALPLQNSGRITRDDGYK